MSTSVLRYLKPSGSSTSRPWVPRCWNRGDGVLEILSSRQFSAKVWSWTDCLLELGQLMDFHLAAPPGPQEMLLVWTNKQMGDRMQPWGIPVCGVNVLDIQPFKDTCRFLSFKIARAVNFDPGDSDGQVRDFIITHSPIDPENVFIPSLFISFCHFACALRER